MWGWLYRLSSPLGFYRFADSMLPWLFGAWLVSYVGGLWWALVVAPVDYQQGDSYRIIFIHVPAAWMSMFVYIAMTVAAVIGLVWRFKLTGVFTAAAAPLGAAFTLLTLLTGSIWGKPTWGTWWVWDARLTSELLLFFLYLGFIVLQNSFSRRRAMEQATAIWLLVSCVIIPIIHFSVEWWNTLHQPASILKFGAPSIHSSMLYPLLLMAVSFKLFFALAILLAMQGYLLRQRRGQ